jgi:hypothetical protein
MKYEELQLVIDAPEVKTDRVRAGEIEVYVLQPPPTVRPPEIQQTVESFPGDERATLLTTFAEQQIDVPGYARCRSPLSREGVTVSPDVSRCDDRRRPCARVPASPRMCTRFVPASP